MISSPSARSPASVPAPTARDDVGLTCSDGILLFYLFSLAHSSLDIMYHETEFGQCQRPIHVWLVVSYLSLVGLRVPHYLRRFYADMDDITDLGSSSSPWKGMSKTCLMVVWFALLPFFTVWTVVGSFWLQEVLEHTPTCLPVGSDPRFIIFWQVVCYVWIVIYVVCVMIALALKRRQGLAESDIRAVETDDTRERWGPVTATWGMAPIWGLSAKEISQLPTCTGFDCDERECSICLSAIDDEDNLRRLPGCSHAFHQSCIDLWLLRQSKCPLCKGDVVPMKSCEMKNLKSLPV